MRTVLKLDIPWFNLCSSLTTIQDDGRINFTRFLDRYRIAMRTTDLVWMEAITDAIAAKLFSAFRTLEESFRRFDEDDSGSITLDELERGLEKLKLGLSKSQLFEIMRSLDTNCDGRVTFDEFVARFRFTFERAAALTHAPLGAAALPPAPLRDAWLSDALHSIGLALAKAGAAGAGAAESAAQAFGVGDTNRDGVLSVAEFATLLGKIGVTFSAEQLAKIYRYVDVKGHNYVNLADVRSSAAPSPCSNSALSLFFSFYPSTTSSSRALPVCRCVQGRGHPQQCRRHHVVVRCWHDRRHGDVCRSGARARDGACTLDLRRAENAVMAAVRRRADHLRPVRVPR